MKIRVVQVGKTKKGYIQEAIADYEKRSSKYFSLEWITIPEVKARKMSANEIIEREGRAILEKIPEKGPIVILDEKGRSMSSKEFAGWIQKQQIEGKSEINFVIGGAYGLSKEIKEKAGLSLSLSRMTFSHQIVRPLFLEQLYRAFSIIKGDPYHNS